MIKNKTKSKGINTQYVLNYLYGLRILLIKAFFFYFFFYFFFIFFIIG